MKVVQQVIYQRTAYERFWYGVLAANPCIATLTALLDEEPLASHADFEELRRLELNMLRFRTRMTISGRKTFTKV